MVPTHWDNQDRNTIYKLFAKLKARLSRILPQSEDHQNRSIAVEIHEATASNLIARCSRSSSWHNVLSSCKRQIMNIFSTTSTSTTASSDESAASRVFEVYELCETILLLVDERTLLLSQRVCRDWADIITMSLHLQRKLFFVPYPHGDPITIWDITIDYHQTPSTPAYDDRTVQKNNTSFSGLHFEHYSPLPNPDWRWQDSPLICSEVDKHMITSCLKFLDDDECNYFLTEVLFNRQYMPASSLGRIVVRLRGGLSRQLVRHGEDYMPGVRYEHASWRRMLLFQRPLAYTETLRTYHLGRANEGGPSFVKSKVCTVGFPTIDSLLIGRSDMRPGVVL